jgi:hypothetical protein
MVVKVSMLVFCVLVPCGLVGIYLQVHRALQSKRPTSALVRKLASYKVIWFSILLLSYTILMIP